MANNVKYSKSRLMKQSTAKSLKYMAPLSVGTVLTITGVMRDTYTDENDVEQLNDSIICADESGQEIKVPVKEYNRMNITGNKFEADSDEDSITLPNEIHIAKAEPRTYKNDKDEVVTSYPLFSYTKHKEFLDSKGAMKWEEVVAGGLIEPKPFAPVQNYSVTVK
jgi:hypothetical protein